jgi:UDP-glucose 4-epimerase
MNILITGKTGYLSKALVQFLSTDHNITCIGRQDLLLTDKAAVNKWFEGKHFDIVLHTAITGGNRLIPETDNILSDNIKMFFNLLYQKDKYNKFISFGSIAEYDLYSSVYGLSKNIIAQYIKDEPKFYNLRICGLFDHNDIDTRFIKNNINNYRLYRDQVIYKDKYMDFIYMEDLLSIVRFYIDNTNPPKLTDCVYKEKYWLSEIAVMINKLDIHKVRIQINDTVKCTPYIGTECKLPITFLGLQEGIKRTYLNLKA